MEENVSTAIKHFRHTFLIFIIANHKKKKVTTLQNGYLINVDDHDDLLHKINYVLNFSTEKKNKMEQKMPLTTSSLLNVLTDIDSYLVDEFYKPIYNEYLTPLAEGKYYNKSWKQFEVGPIKGRFTVYMSYIWLWCMNKEKIYPRIQMGMQ